MTAGFRALLVCMGLWLTWAGTAAAAIINEPMTGATAPGWVIGGSAYLTASTGVDPTGNGWLRLTEPSNDQAGYGYLNSAFNITQGAVISYDYVTWGGAGDPGGGTWGSTGADGYSIYLFDGSQNFSVGASGGSLGYAQKSVTPVNPGLSYGYVGVGIDEWGNFSSPTEGRIGGSGQRVNSVAVRGPYNHPSGSYYYLGGAAANIAQLTFPGQVYRPDQAGTEYRRVVIYLTPQPPPNYLRVDVYLQTGYGQLLNQVVTGLMVGQPVPATVKIGYAASTGGATNYHEIRNLIIDPLPSSDIDLSVTKSVSSPTVAPGGAIGYTVTVRNNGPSSVTANNVPLSDTVPAQITGVTWTCTGSGGATCGAASGSGNAISTKATLPVSGSVTYLINGTVAAATPLGTQITNIATLAVPGGLTDYNPANNSATATTTVASGTVTLSGTIFNDNGAGGGTAHDGVRNGSEAAVTATNVGNTYYVKVFRSSDLSTLVGSATVSGGASTYSISVPGYGTYTGILSTDNTATFNPSLATNGRWIYTVPLNYTLTNVTVSSINLANQNFGVIQGSRISGKVINDNGLNGSASNANDGILNAAETGIAGVALRLTDNTGGPTYDTATTDSGGNFSLFTNTGSATLRIYETNAAGYVSVNFNAGTIGGTYIIASDYISFAYTQYTDYSGIVFGDAAASTFIPTPISANGSSLTPVYYAQTFSPGSGGSVTFSSTHTQGTWPAIVLYQDATCSGVYNAADPVISGAVATKAGTPVCILVKSTIAAGAANGATDMITTTANFTYTNSIGPVTSAPQARETTTVVYPPSLTVVKSTSPSPTVSPGQVITYTVQITNTGTGVATVVVASDHLSPYVYWGMNSYGAGVAFQFANGAPASGLALGTPAYSNDNGATWTYPPVSGAGGAPVGYDGNVTNWRIPLTGTMNAKGANFSLSYKGIVK